jgi:hypothetical protein
MHAAFDHCSGVSQHAVPPVLGGQHGCCASDTKVPTQLMLLLNKLKALLGLWHKASATVR